MAGENIRRGERGEGRAVGMVGDGVDRGGAGGSVTAAEVVGADDKKAAGINGAARSDKSIPPSWMAFFGPAVAHSRHVGIKSGGVLAAGHGMENQNGI